MSLWNFKISSFVSEIYIKFKQNIILTKTKYIYTDIEMYMRRKFVSICGISGCILWPLKISLLSSTGQKLKLFILLGQLQLLNSVIMEIMKRCFSATSGLFMQTHGYVITNCIKKYKLHNLYKICNSEAVNAYSCKEC